MSIDTQCKGCNAVLRSDEAHIGRQARCPKCGTIYTIEVSNALETILQPVEIDHPSTPAQLNPGQTIASQTNQGPRGFIQKDSVNPYADTLPGSQALPDTYEDRSGWVLALGILSWVLSCACFGQILAIVGIVLGHQELAYLRSRRIQDNRYTLTQVGYYLSIANIVLSALGIFAYVAFIVVMVIANA